MENIDKPFYVQLALPAAILAAALIISGTLLYTKKDGAQNPNTSTTATPVAKAANLKIIETDHVLGVKSAKLTIFEYSDFQCFFCRNFWKDSFAQLKKEYIDTGKVNFVYRHFPLDLHPAAYPSAKAVECANDQGKYWQMFDKIFSEQDKKGQGTIQYSIDDLKKWGVQIGLDKTKFDECIDSDKYKAIIDSNYASGMSNGVDGTPYFFIGSQTVKGAQPYSSFKTAIDVELAKVK